MFHQAGYCPAIAGSMFHGGGSSGGRCRFALGAGEVRLAEVTGADGVTRGRAEYGHDRPVVTRLGEVRVRRIGYRAGIKGVPSLFPRDAVLNLPPLGYSWGLQQLAGMFCRSGSYEQARGFVLAATGVGIGKRQLEQIAAGAAADVAAFYAVPAPGQEPAGPTAAPGGPGERQPCRPEGEKAL